MALNTFGGGYGGMLGRNFGGMGMGGMGGMGMGWMGASPYGINTQQRYGLGEMGGMGLGWMGASPYGINTQQRYGMGGMGGMGMGGLGGMGNAGGGRYGVPLQPSTWGNTMQRPGQPYGTAPAYGNITPPAYSQVGQGYRVPELPQATPASIAAQWTPEMLERSKAVQAVKAAEQASREAHDRAVEAKFAEFGGNIPWGTTQVRDIFGTPKPQPERLSGYAGTVQQEMDATREDLRRRQAEAFLKWWGR